MRGMIDGLESAIPLAPQLPAVYQEDDFTQRLVSAFDAMLAPILATLDDLPVYVDPRLAPDDFVSWLAGWVGAQLEHAATPAARREIVATAVALHRRRGTVGGVADAVRIATGGSVEVVESGAARWARVPDAALPGEPTATLHVRVTYPGGTAGDADAHALEALVASAKPAHVVHTVEVVES
jgi:phage tail-like protein